MSGIKLGNLGGGGSFDRFTGFINYEVIAVNPTLAELKEAGVEWVSQEPVYQRTFDNDGDQVTITEVVFWLKSTDEEVGEIIMPIRFPISATPFVGSASGKCQYVNLYGRTTWAMDIEAAKVAPYFKPDGVRPAHKGERELYDFIRAWLNLSYNTKKNTYDQCLLDVSKILALDFSELKDTFSNVKAYQDARNDTYKVKVLTGLRTREDDSGTTRYNYVAYNKYFIRHFIDLNKRPDMVKSIEEFLSGDYNEFGTETNPIIYTVLPTKFDENAVKADAPEQQAPIDRPAF